MADKFEAQDQQYQVVAKATIDVQLIIDVKARSLGQAASRGMDALSSMIFDDIDPKKLQYLGFQFGDTFVERIIDGKAAESKWVRNM